MSRVRKPSANLNDSEPAVSRKSLCFRLLRIPTFCHFGLGPKFPFEAAKLYRFLWIKVPFHACCRIPAPAGVGFNGPSSLQPPYRALDPIRLLCPQGPRAWPWELLWPMGCSQMRCGQRPEKVLCVPSLEPLPLPREGHAWADQLEDEKQAELSHFFILPKVNLDLPAAS